MAWAYVNANGASNAGSSVSIVSPGLAVTAGNTLIVGVSSYTLGGRQTVVGVTDSAGNSYSRCGIVEGGDANHGQEVWVASNISAHATNVVTVTFSAAATYRNMAVAQYSGLAATSPFDAASTGAITASSTIHPTGAGTTTQDNELCLGWFVTWDVAFSFSASGGNTLRVTAGDTCLVDNNQAVAGSASVTVNTSGSTTLFAQMRTFKAATSSSVVSSDFATAYDIRSQTSSDFSTRYDLLNAAQSDFTVVYDNLNMVFSQFSSSYSVRQIVGSEYEVVFDVRGLTAGDFQAIYDMAGQVFSGFTVAYDIKGGKLHIRGGIALGLDFGL